jgi:hypothetical protein
MPPYYERTQAASKCREDVKLIKVAREVSVARQSPAQPCTCERSQGGLSIPEPYYGSANGLLPVDFTVAVRSSLTCKYRTNRISNHTTGAANLTALMAPPEDHAAFRRLADGIRAFDVRGIGYLWRLSP